MLLKPECLDSIEISDDDVMSAIDKLNNKLSSGPDGLLPFLFKQLKFSLSKPLSPRSSTNYCPLV